MENTMHLKEQISIKELVKKGELKYCDIKSYIQNLMNNYGVLVWCYMEKHIIVHFSRSSMKMIDDIEEDTLGFRIHLNVGLSICCDEIELDVWGE